MIAIKVYGGMVPLDAAEAEVWGRTEAENAARLQALRKAILVGIDDIEAGRYKTLPRYCNGQSEVLVSGKRKSTK
jgi:hypothetical protein